jgi:hypothetical protein
MIEDRRPYSPTTLAHYTVRAEAIAAYACLAWGLTRCKCGRWIPKRSKWCGLCGVGGRGLSRTQEPF